MAQQAIGCFRQGGVFILFHAGLREALANAEQSRHKAELIFMRITLRGLRDEDWREMESFCVCAPPPPACPESAYVPLGWHFIIRHAFSLPKRYSRIPVPDGAHVLGVSRTRREFQQLRVRLSASVTVDVPGRSGGTSEAISPEEASEESIRARGGSSEEIAGADGGSSWASAVQGAGPADWRFASLCALSVQPGQPQPQGAILDEECLLLSADPEGPSHRCRKHFSDEELQCCKNDSVAEAAGAGVWPGAEAVLPDFDCLANSLADDIWADIRSFLDSLGLFHATGSARSGGWAGEAAEREIWERYATHLFRYRDAGAVSSDQALDAECPFGFFALQVARWGACLLAGGASASPRCSALRVHFGHVLLDAPYGMCEMHSALPVLLNSRWVRPICELTASLLQDAKRLREQLDPNGFVQKVFDCTAVSGQTIDWNEYRELLVGGNTQFTDGSTVKFIFSSGWGTKVMRLASECPIGALMMFLEKIRITQAMKTEEYGAFAHGIGSLLLQLERVSPWGVGPVDSLSVLMLTDWPVFNLLCSMAFQAQALRDDQESYGYQHKPYDLDFLPGEMLRPPAERAELARLRGLSALEHLDVLRGVRRGRTSVALRALLAALETALGVAEVASGTSHKVVFITMIWGARLSVYLRSALERAQAFSLGRSSLVFCLDDESCNTCKAVHFYPANCVAGRLKTIYNKYTIISAVVNLGFDAVYLDFDTVLMRNPMPPIMAAAEDAEILVSRDFGSDCLNTGVIYFKAHADTADFLSTLLVWLWHHPYEFSQKAFSAFLLVENVTREPYRLPILKVPRWAHLDPANSFVTSTVYNPEVEGWTGDIDKIVIYHFLDGTGGVDPTRAVKGQYTNLYDLFYANPALNLSDVSVPLWRQDEQVEHSLLWSRRPRLPGTLHPCMLYPDLPEP